jgi:preprotein translocase subunit SecF
VNDMTTSPTTVRRSAWSRLFRGETAIDLYGRRRRFFVISAVLLLVTLGSLLARGVVLGIDFEGGVAWQVPATATMDLDTAREVLDANGVDASNAKIQKLQSASEATVRIQVGDQPAEVRTAVQNALAERAGVDAQDVSVTSVSSSWGRSITEKAVRALVIFIVLVTIYISWRFEWRMALAAIAAMIHDVVISVGVYSIFQLEVTPATVVAFLTILGYSLYDTIVVFDKVQDNVKHFAGTRVPMGDIVNVSSNQVLMRSINTTVSSLLPVLALLILGAGVFDVTTLREFALALLVGMLTGAYSSLFLATPLLAVLKVREPKYAGLGSGHQTGDALRQMVISGLPSGARAARRIEATEGRPLSAQPESATTVLTHPPRPRKKRRR